jgi:hypothetical protein
MPAMLATALACLLLLALTTLIHYEALRLLNGWLPSLTIRTRAKLLVVMFVVFFAHAIEILVYGAGYYVLIAWFGIGGLAGEAGFSFATCLYLSSETYTSLGFGDVTPLGPVRLMAGAETLNGLLLIAWTASYAYLAMERYWTSAPNDSRVL